MRKEFDSLKDYNFLYSRIEDVVTEDTIRNYYLASSLRQDISDSVIQIALRDLLKFSKKYNLICMGQFLAMKYSNRGQGYINPEPSGFHQRMDTMYLRENAFRFVHHIMADHGFELSELGKYAPQILSKKATDENFLAHALDSALEKEFRVTLQPNEPSEPHETLTL